MVTVSNESSVPLRTINFIGGGCWAMLHEVRPRETVTRSLWFSPRDQLKMTAEFGERQLTAVVEPNTTHPSPNGALIMVQDDGEAVVTHPAVR